MSTGPSRVWSGTARIARTAGTRTGIDPSGAGRRSLVEQHGDGRAPSQHREDTFHRADVEPLLPHGRDVTGTLPRVRRWTPLLPPVLLAVVVVLDAIDALRPWPLLVTGLLDEPAHLATAALALCALAPRRPPPWLWKPALAASVLIDVDHVPAYLFNRFYLPDGRPPTHSLTLVVALAALGLAGPRMRWALGAAIGVLLHFLRDLATGPGVGLLWPASDESFRVPYPAYLVTVVVLALVASWRLLRLERERR